MTIGPRVISDTVSQLNSEFGREHVISNTVTLIEQGKLINGHNNSNN